MKVWIQLHFPADCSVSASLLTSSRCSLRLISALRPLVVPVVRVNDAVHD